MTVITITQNTPVLVAIDIAKARHEVLIEPPLVCWRLITSSHATISKALNCA